LEILRLKKDIPVASLPWQMEAKFLLIHRMSNINLTNNKFLFENLRTNYKVILSPPTEVRDSYLGIL
jgi:hypothetical protein